MSDKYFVYALIDYKGYYFYIGITKNLAIRIKEHIKCKGNNPAKNYRVRKCISVHGELRYKYDTFPNIKEAREKEKELITKYHRQLVNIQHGKNKSKPQRKRKTGRAAQCPHCGNWYRRINAHRCKNGPTTSE